MTGNWNSKTLHRKWAFQLADQLKKLPLALSQINDQSTAFHINWYRYVTKEKNGEYKIIWLR
jgi:hypothetical protein